MADYDFAKLPHLLARLDETLPSSGLPFTDSWQAERREAAAAIRALMAEGDRVREFVGAVEKLLDWMNGCDLSADHEEQKPDDYSRLCESLIDMHCLLGGSPVSPGPCAAAVAAEREACARVCEKQAAEQHALFATTVHWQEVTAKEKTALRLADLIRARGAA